LLLPAREFVRGFAETVRDAEPTCGLSDAQAYRFGRNAEIFKPVCEFVPDLIRNYLFIGVLHNKTYIGGGFAVGQRRKRLAAEFYVAALFPARRKFAFKQFEKRGLAATRRAAEQNKVALTHLQTDVFDGGSFGFGVCESQIFDTEYFHTIASLISTANGISESAAKAM